MVPMFVPIVFHNLEGYDSHLFVKCLGLTEGDINCIPKTDEKYISFTKKTPMETYKDVRSDGSVVEKTIHLEMRFIDSLKFTLKSLDSLVSTLRKDQFKTLTNQMISHLLADNRSQALDLLKKKGVFPYEHMSDFSKLSSTSLPPKSAFYSQLNKSNISDTEYDHAKKVWSTFHCKTMCDYHDVYLRTDVLLLADVMTEFRRVCKSVYGLEAFCYYTSPGLAWDAMLKITGAVLDLISDPNMYLMIEKGIRGGVSTVTKRYAKANNKYLNNYDPACDSIYLPYLDANNLYGWAMCQTLPVKDFTWMTVGEISDWGNTPCILEVDLEYPNELHDFHNEYPLAPEKICVNKVDKLTPNLHD